MTAEKNEFVEDLDRILANKMTRQVIKLMAFAMVGPKETHGLFKLLSDRCYQLERRS